MYTMEMDPAEELEMLRNVYVKEIVSMQNQMEALQQKNDCLWFIIACFCFYLLGRQRNIKKSLGSQVISWVFFLIFMCPVFFNINVPSVVLKITSVSTDVLTDFLSFSFDNHYEKSVVSTTLFICQLVLMLLPRVIPKKLSKRGTVLISVLYVINIFTPIAVHQFVAGGNYAVTLPLMFSHVLENHLEKVFLIGFLILFRTFIFVCVPESSRYNRKLKGISNLIFLVIVMVRSSCYHRFWVFAALNL